MCGFVETYTPQNTSGETRKWVCYCKTTCCQYLIYISTGNLESSARPLRTQSESKAVWPNFWLMRVSVNWQTIGFQLRDCRFESYHLRIWQLVGTLSMPRVQSLLSLGEAQNLRLISYHYADCAGRKVGKGSLYSPPIQCNASTEFKVRQLVLLCTAWLIIAHA